LRFAQEKSTLSEKLSRVLLSIAFISALLLAPPESVLARL
jgi:hypothetical protein